MRISFLITIFISVCLLSGCAAYECKSAYELTRDISTVKLKAYNDRYDKSNYSTQWHKLDFNTSQLDGNTIKINGNADFCALDNVTDFEVDFAKTPAGDIDTGIRVQKGDLVSFTVQPIMRRFEKCDDMSSYGDLNINVLDKNRCNDGYTYSGDDNKKQSYKSYKNEFVTGYQDQSHARDIGNIVYYNGRNNLPLNRLYDAVVPLGEISNQDLKEDENTNNGELDLRNCNEYYKMDSSAIKYPKGHSKAGQRKYVYPFEAIKLHKKCNKMCNFFIEDVNSKSDCLFTGLSFSEPVKTVTKKLLDPDGNDTKATYEEEQLPNDQKKYIQLVTSYVEISNGGNSVLKSPSHRNINDSYVMSKKGHYYLINDHSYQVQNDGKLMMRTYGRAGITTGGYKLKIRRDCSVRAKQNIYMYTGPSMPNFSPGESGSTSVNWNNTTLDTHFIDIDIATHGDGNNIYFGLNYGDDDPKGKDNSGFFLAEGSIPKVADSQFGTIVDNVNDKILEVLYGGKEFDQRSQDIFKALKYQTTFGGLSQEVTNIVNNRSKKDTLDDKIVGILQKNNRISSIKIEIQSALNTANNIDEIEKNMGKFIIVPAMKYEIDQIFNRFGTNVYDINNSLTALFNQYGLHEPQQEILDIFNIRAGSDEIKDEINQIIDRRNNLYDPTREINGILDRRGLRKLSARYFAFSTDDVKNDIVKVVNARDSFTDSSNEIDEILRTSRVNLTGSRCTDATAGAVCKVYFGIIKDVNARRILNAMLILFIALNALFYMMGVSQLSTQSLIINMIKIVIVHQILQPYSWDFFTNNFLNFFIDGPRELLGYIASAPDSFAGDGTNKGGFAGLNYTMGKLLVPELWYQILSVAFTSVVGIFAFIAIALALLTFFVAIINAIVMYFLATTYNAVLIAAAPIFFAMILFQYTSKIFHAWTKVFVKNLVQVIFTFAVITLLNKVQMNLIHAITGYGVCIDCVLEVFMTEKVPAMCVLYGPVPDNFPVGVGLEAREKLSAADDNLGILALPMQISQIIALVISSALIRMFVKHITAIADSITGIYVGGLNEAMSTLKDTSLSLIGMDNQSIQNRANQQFEEKLYPKDQEMPESAKFKRDIPTNNKQGEGTGKAGGGSHGLSSGKATGGHGLSGGDGSGSKGSSKMPHQDLGETGVKNSEPSAPPAENKDIGNTSRSESAVPTVEDSNDGNVVERRDFIDDLSSEGNDQSQSSSNVPPSDYDDLFPTSNNEETTLLPEDVNENDGNNSESNTQPEDDDDPDNRRGGAQ